MPIINTEEPAIEQTMVFPEMLQAFERHLDGEFSSENMAFLQAMQDLQTNAGDPSISDAALKQQAADIYDHYVKVGSVRQVNLPTVTVKALEVQLDNLATMNRQEMVGAFDTSYNDVNRLITRDSFPRFARSEGFRTAAEKVESNLTVEDQIEDLREEARQALLNPSVGDRMKSSVGSKTRAQELSGQADTLQSELEASRALKPLDIPPSNMVAVTHAISQLADQHRDFAARQAAEHQARQERERALKESQAQGKGKDVDEPLQEHEWEQPKPDLEQLQEHDWEQPMPDLGPGQDGQDEPLAPQRVGSPSVSSVSDGLEEPRMPEFQIGDDGWPELEEQEGMQQQQQPQQLAPQPQPEIEVEDMSAEDLAQLNLGEGRGRGERVDSDLGQTRGRSKGMDNTEVGVGQTRGRSRGMPEAPEPPKPSVRDSLGRRDSQPKQGQGGPKVH